MFAEHMRVLRQPILQYEPLQSLLEQSPIIVEPKDANTNHSPSQVPIPRPVSLEPRTTIQKRA